MDERFRPAQTAIESGDGERLASHLAADPTLATGRSGFDHPTLLQCLVLTMPPCDSLESMIEAFISLGADPTDSLIAASGVGNLRAISKLIALGARIDGNDRWSPLEEALYWGHPETVEVLLNAGAKATNLRVAAALGDLDSIERCFDSEGHLTGSAGVVAWPFCTPIPEPDRTDRAQILGNALVYAAAWDRAASVERLLDRGADVNIIPAGFDFAGTPLHYAALRGHRSMIDRLIGHGADPGLPDSKIGKYPEDWAAHDGHPELADHLRRARVGAN